MRWPHGWCRQNNAKLAFPSPPPIPNICWSAYIQHLGQETPFGTILEQVSTPLLDRYIIYRWHRIQAWIQKETHLLSFITFFDNFAFQSDKSFMFNSIGFPQIANPFLSELRTRWQKTMERIEPLNLSRQFVGRFNLLNMYSFSTPPETRRARKTPNDIHTENTI